MSLHLWVALALSTLIGVWLGLLGGGGPLAIVGTTSLVGALVHARAGRVDAQAAALSEAHKWASSPASWA